MRRFTAFAAGLLFGLGLIVSGMANPVHVLSFLDIFGDWDPGLALVMGGAVVVTTIGYRLTFSRPGPLLATRFNLPARSDIDARLVTGAATFGIGWGLSGLCPGPALVALPLAATGTLIFVPFMLLGIWAVGRLDREAAPIRTPAE